MNISLHKWHIIIHITESENTHILLEIQRQFSNHFWIPNILSCCEHAKRKCNVSCKVAKPEFDARRFHMSEIFTENDAGASDLPPAIFFEVRSESCTRGGFLDMFSAIFKDREYTMDGQIVGRSTLDDKRIETIQRGSEHFTIFTILEPEPEPSSSL